MLSFIKYEIKTKLLDLFIILATLFLNRIFLIQYIGDTVFIFSL